MADDPVRLPGVRAPLPDRARLAEYEDYALRLLQDAGIAVPRPYGIVEITPEREYLLVTEYFDGAVEIGGADLDDQLIYQGLQLIRTLWDAGSPTATSSRAT